MKVPRDTVRKMRHTSLWNKSLLANIHSKKVLLAYELLKGKKYRCANMERACRGILRKEYLYFATHKQSFLMKSILLRKSAIGITVIG